MNYTFDQAKQAVAERHGYETWKQFYLAVQGTKYEYEANVEVFQIGCNEAVKADRSELNTILESHGQYFSRTVVRRPLPFPES